MKEAGDEYGQQEHGDNNDSWDYERDEVLSREEVGDRVGVLIIILFNRRNHGGAGFHRDHLIWHEMII